MSTWKKAAPNLPPSNSMHTEPSYHTAFQHTLGEPHDLLAVLFSPEPATLGFAFLAGAFLLLLLFRFFFPFESRLVCSVPSENDLIYKKYLCAAGGKS